MQMKVILQLCSGLFKEILPSEVRNNFPEERNLGNKLELVILKGRNDMSRKNEHGLKLCGKGNRAIPRD